MQQRLIKQKNTMNAITFAGVTALLLCSISASDSAIITISGKVLANTCTIDSTSAMQNIVLSDMADQDIKGAGRTGGEKNIIIILKDCGKAASNVVVSASGTEDKDNSSAFANNASNGAKSVGLYFYQTNGVTKFKPDGSVKETSKLSPSLSNTLTYKGSYVSTTETVKACPFSTVVNMQFDYQ